MEVPFNAIVKKEFREESAFTKFQAKLEDVGVVIEVFNLRYGSMGIRIPENQISTVKDFEEFQAISRCKTFVPLYIKEDS